MVWYFIKRILLIIPIILAVILAVLALLYTLPGTNLREIDTYGGGDALDCVFSFLKLSDGFLTKYIRFSYNVFFNFDFGDSANGVAITRELSLRIKLTLLLSGLSLAATLVFGIPAGMWAAIHRKKWQDNTITFLTVLLSSVPIFVLALLFTLLFALKLKWVPSFGYLEPKSLILPIVTLSVSGIAILTRMTRSSMLSVLNEQFITTLRSKGLKERAVIYCHALKNLMIPVISVISSLTSQLLCGALVVESFFSIPGIGYYLVSAISKREVSILLGCTVLIATMLTLVNVFTDLLYALVNPQFKAQFTKGSSSKSEKGVANES